MENPTKKLKLSDEVASTDPFAALHEDLHQHIFQFLSGKDVLNLFLTSKQWNRLANESSAAMSKIQLNFREWSGNDPLSREVTALLQSERQYQNIDAVFRYLANAGRKLLLLQRFSPSIVELTVRFDNEKLAAHLPPDLSFPKIKALNVAGLISTQFNFKVIEAATDLEKLSINTHGMNGKLVDCIKQKKKLKELTLTGNREQFFGAHSFHDAQFKLTSLLFENSGNYLSNQARTNFETFVLQMAKTLTSLSIDVCFSEDVNLVLNKLPALNRFQANLFWFGNPMQLQSNNTIKEFKCHSFDYISRQVLACFTGLEVLKVMELDDDDFEFIMLNMKGLKKLHLEEWFGVFDESDEYELNADELESAQNFYDQLKADDLEINGNVEIIVSKYYNNV